MKLWQELFDEFINGITMLVETRQTWHVYFSEAVILDHVFEEDESQLFMGVHQELPSYKIHPLNVANFLLAGGYCPQHPS